MRLKVDLRGFSARGSWPRRCQPGPGARWQHHPHTWDGGALPEGRHQRWAHQSPPLHRLGD